MAKWLWRYRQLAKKLWFRATLYSLMGLLTAIAGIVFGGFIPEELSSTVGAESVDGILTIIASSMLTVTVFSLTTMVAATAAASSSTTPRVTKLLIEDTTSQRALSTFLGAFLFSLVGLIALKAEFYQPGGKLVLFAVTLGMVTLIVVTLLRWISYLSVLGRVGQTIDRAEDAVTKAMRDYDANPLFGGKLLGEIPENAIAIYASSIGYVEHLDMSALTTICDTLEADIYISMRPGGFAVPSRAVAYILFDKPVAVQELHDDIRISVARAFTIKDARSFEQDPRFGLIVLCEIALRALSPAVNDPGTAIDVIGTLIRVLAVAADAAKTDVDHDQRKIQHPRVYVPALKVKDFIEDAFMPITRDGAAMLEVSIKLQKACAALAVLNEDFRLASDDLARLSLRRSLEAMTFEPDRQRLIAEAAVPPVDD